MTPGGTSGQLLGVDAVKEFNVVSDTYGASYGKRAGAQVSIVTTSGTNQLHGTAFEFVRNSALDARNYFDQGSIPELQRNQFGGSLGGPLRKDRLFLFGNYEGFRQAWGLSAVTLRCRTRRPVPDICPTSRATRRTWAWMRRWRLCWPLWPAQNGPELGGGIGEAAVQPSEAAYPRGLRNGAAG